MLKLTSSSNATPTDWAGIPKHLLELIVGNLELSTDLLSFGLVCVPWLSVIQDNQTRLKTNFCHQAPLLLIPDEHDVHTWRAYDATKDEFLESKLLVPYERRFCGSSEGWLVAVNRDSTVTLHKPAGLTVTESSIHLPCIFPREFEPGMDGGSDIEDFVDPAEVSDYHIIKAIVKSDPNVTSSDHLTVVAIFGEFNELAFIRYGEDETWSKIDTGYNNTRFRAVDVLHYKDQFYAVSCKCGLLSFNLTDAWSTTVKLVAPPPDENAISDSNKYIVKSCGGELLLVKRYIDWLEDRAAGRVTLSFEVFQFDFDGKKWVELTSLGDTTLFLGDNYSVCVLASDFSGCQSNCIYFTHDTDDIEGWQKTTISDLGVYHMEDKSFKLHYTIDPAALKKMSRRPPIWFAPRILL